MREPKLSVIIPTHNRKEILEKGLGLYALQTYPSDLFEVIVIDDGGNDGMEEMIKQMSGKVTYRLSYLRQEKKGPAAARNKGIRRAEGEIILIMGDDILPKEDMLERHAMSHLKHKDAAILGYVEWSPEIEVTGFMRYIAPAGAQFRYDTITDIYDCGCRHFYTAHISLNKKWFKEDLLNEDFPYAGLEDTEIGYRLEKKGLKIVFDRSAIGYHYHHTTLESFCRGRMRVMGFYSPILLKKCPELKPIFLPVPMPLLKIAYKALEILSAFPIIERINKRFWWRSQLTLYYLEGLFEAQRGRKQALPT